MREETIRKFEAEKLQTLKDNVDFSIAADIAAWLTESGNIDEKLDRILRAAMERERIIESIPIKVISRAVEVLGDRERALKWLLEPNQALGRKIPAEQLDTDDGVEEVLNMICRIEYGVYS